VDYPREKNPNLTPIESGHFLTGRAKLCNMFRVDVFLSENPRLAHVRYYLPGSKPQAADGNEVSPVGSGLSLNPRKNRLLCCHRLAGLDPTGNVPDFAKQVLMHAVKAGLTEIQEDHYKCIDRGRVRFGRTRFRGTRETRLSMPSFAMPPTVTTQNSVLSSCNHPCFDSPRAQRFNAGASWGSVKQVSSHIEVVETQFEPPRAQNQFT
jgi:hypothetical protein